MELLWQNGQVVMQSQNQRPFRKPLPPATNTGDGLIPAREIRSSEPENYSNQHLFMQEDEMASWLHASIDEDPHHGFSADILCPPAKASGGRSHCGGAVQAPVRAAELHHPPRPAAPRPPIPRARRPEKVASRIHNFAHFSKHGNARAEPGPSKVAAARESTVVDSCDTPIMAAKAAAATSRLLENSGSSAETGRGSMSAAGKAASSAGGRETGTFDMTVTSSPGGSSGSAEPDQREPALDRKRKSQEPEDSEFQSEVSKLTQLKKKNHLYFYFSIFSNYYVFKKINKINITHT